MVLILKRSKMVANRQWGDAPILRAMALCSSSKHPLMLALFCCALFQGIASSTAVQGSSNTEHKVRAAKASAKAPSSSPSKSPSTSSPVSSPSLKNPSPAPSVKAPLKAVSTPSSPTRISSSKIGQPVQPAVWSQASTPGYSINRYGSSNTLPWFLLLGTGIGLVSMTRMTSCSSGTYLYSNRCRSNTHVRLLLNLE
jgi:hypothetical protein